MLLDRGRIDLEGLLGLPELLDLGLDADQSIALGRLWSQITLFLLVVVNPSFSNVVKRVCEWLGKPK